MHKFILTRLLPMLAYCGLIFFFSSREAEELSLFFFFPGEDKIIHAIEYGILGFLLIRCFEPWKKMEYCSMLPVFLGTMYGISDEYHQSFVSGRQASIEDILADVAGLLFVATVYQLSRKKRSGDSKILQHENINLEF